MPYKRAKDFDLDFELSLCFGFILSLIFLILSTLALFLRSRVSFELMSLDNLDRSMRASLSLDTHPDVSKGP